MFLIYAISYQQYLFHLQGWKTNFGIAVPIYQKTINKIISFYNFFFVNLYLSTASNKYFRYATSNKPYFFICCSPFIKTFLWTMELIRRQFVNILKVRIIVFVRTIQTIPINNINCFLTAQQSFINVLLNRYYIRTIWYKESPTISQELQDETKCKIA